MTTNSRVCACRYCGCQLLHTKKTKRRIVCRKDECLKKYHAARHRAYHTSQATLANLRGWHVALLATLERDWVPVESDIWVTHKDAWKIAQITSAQLTWLAIRRIVHVKEDPHRSWRGQPVRLFSISELEVVRRVHSELFESAVAKHADGEAESA